MKEIREDVRLRIIGAHCDAIEEVYAHLHLPPCLNKRDNLSDMTPADIVDTFWNEFKAFLPFTTQAVGLLKMYQMEDPTFGMRSIHLTTQRCWGL